MKILMALLSIWTLGMMKIDNISHHASGGIDKRKL